MKMQVIQFRVDVVELVSLPVGARGSETPAVLLHAAELLEQEAACLAEGHTIKGRWEQARMDDLDRMAKASHDDMLATAEKLRLLASPNENKLSYRGAKARTLRKQRACLSGAVSSSALLGVMVGLGIAVINSQHLAPVRIRHELHLPLSPRAIPLVQSEEKIFGNMTAAGHGVRQGNAVVNESRQIAMQSLHDADEAVESV